MSTLGAFALKADRAERPGFFWFNTTVNLIVVLGMLFGLYVAIWSGRS
jgi:hypothetical protein